VVLEKPLGATWNRPSRSTCEVGKVFAESQIYRIDHYLGKETVQNLLALRFGNILFEPLWRREWISDVQITIAEKIGVGNRLGYYDNSGALRDMLQNHLLQLLCIVAMEPPTSIAPDAVRDAKLQVLRSLKRFTPTTLSQNIVRGQYRAGYVDGQAGAGLPRRTGRAQAVEDRNLRRHEGRDRHLALGRRALLPAHRQAHGRPPGRNRGALQAIPHSIFNQPTSSFQPNSLVIRLQPDEGLSMNLMAKTPGDSMRLKQAELELDFREQFKTPRMEAYERLLLDVLRGQLTLFMRGDELEAAWEWVEPILHHWEQDDTTPAPYSLRHLGPGRVLRADRPRRPAVARRSAAGRLTDKDDICCSIRSAPSSTRSRSPSARSRWRCWKPPAPRSARTSRRWRAARRCRSRPWCASAAPSATTAGTSSS
jgi:glucose-6-phosphate 1-dehydrogenase